MIIIDRIEKAEAFFSISPNLKELIMKSKTTLKLTLEEYGYNLSNYIYPVNGLEMAIQEAMERYARFYHESKVKEFDKNVVKSRVVYEETGQDILSKGTIVYNFDTKEEDVIVDYKNGKSSITAKGRHFHVSANVLGGGWKAVRKIYY